MKIERDQVEVTGGVRHGRTLGGPIALQVVNRDYANWEERMNPWPVEAETAEVHLPRPGHADLVGTQKYGLSDVRDVLERASARETAARVAGGAVAKAFLRALVEVFSHVIQITGVKAPRREALKLEDFDHVDESPVRCLDPEASTAMVAEIDRLRKANESLGGVFEVLAFGLVPGLGSHVSWEERLDGRPRAGDPVDPGAEGGLDRRRDRGRGPPGSQAHDEIFYDDGRGYYRETNRAGGRRGRHDDRRDARRARLDEAAADADQAAALGGHRHARAGRGAARAHRLVHRAGGGRWSARRWSPSSSPMPTAASSAATTSTTSLGALRAPTMERIGWRAADRLRADPRSACIGFMGAGKTTAGCQPG